MHLIRTMINKQFITCNEYLNFIDCDYVRNFNGVLELISTKKVNITLKNIKETIILNQNLTYEILLGTLIKSKHELQSIDNIIYIPIEHTNDYYVYQISTNCKLLYYKINNYNSKAIFETL